jgi:anti-anti-sigma regulatory factor
MSYSNVQTHHALASALPFLLSLERKADEKEALWLRFLLSPANGASGTACSVTTRVSDSSIPYATAIGWHAAESCSQNTRASGFTTAKENSMLKISILEGRKQRRLVVEGKLVAPWSDELKAACERAGSGLNGRELVIDLKNITTISGQGEDLLLELMKQGVGFGGCGMYTSEILNQVARRLRRNGAHE